MSVFSERINIIMNTFNETKDYNKLVDNTAKVIIMHKGASGGSEEDFEAINTLTKLIVENKPQKEGV